ncbi:MAG TPA: hypothetical protein VD862_02825 [Candidatus Paceibacterota bacterium]|nr:hypothetical protein [Candidatus Paceibacterota bacterium]
MPGKKRTGQGPVKGYCPSCRRHTLARKRRGRLIFWGCQNPVCSRMFWRAPFESRSDGQRAAD